MPKYLIIKGYLGFGDRLETLKMWVKYAIDNNLKVYVDWRDEIWSHGSETFYSYFKFIDLPTIESLDEIPKDSIVYPEYWKDRMNEQLTFDHRKIFKEKLELGTINNGLNIPPNIDVIVASSMGNRTLFVDSLFFSKVFRVIHPRILEKVKERNKNYNLSSCVGVHIRGTDRKKDLTQFTRKIQFMSLNAIHHGGLNNIPMIAVSDDKVGVEIWKRFFPQTIVLSDLSIKSSSDKGNHNVKSDELVSSKDEMNIDMLIDFFTLSFCKTIMTTYKDSRFYQEAVRLSPHVKRILGE